MDRHLGKITGIRLPYRPSGFKIVYHLYMVFAERRNELLKFCLDQGIEAKIHYPTPIYRQPALQHLNLSEGSFPVTDRHARSIITFPCDQHLTQTQLELIVDTVNRFYFQGV